MLQIDVIPLTQKKLIAMPTKKAETKLARNSKRAKTQKQWLHKSMLSVDVK